MKKLLTGLILLKICTCMNAQPEIKIFARLHSAQINKVLYQSNPLRTTMFTTDKLSDIIEFGQIDGVIFGIKVEVHESSINPEVSYIIRRNFYFKKKGELKWRKINSDMNTYKILESSYDVDFTEINKLGNHNSFQTNSIDGEYVSFKITYDCVYQWK